MKIKVKWHGIEYYLINTYYVEGGATLGSLVSMTTKQIISNVDLRELEVIDSEYLRKVK